MAKKSRLYTYPNGQPSDGQKVQLEFDNIYEGVNNIDAEQISAGAITGDKLANGSVTGLKLENLSITTTKLIDGAVTTPKLADASITSPKIADNAITTIHIADGSVTNSKLKGNIEQSKILDSGYLTTRIDKKIESEIITSGSLPNVGNTHVLKTTQGATIFPITIASSISATTIGTGSGDTVQSQLEWLLLQIQNVVLNQIPDGIVTMDKLATTLADLINGHTSNIGDLATLTTTDKTNLVGAVNELVSQSAQILQLDNTEAKNSIYRGKYLGNTYTLPQQQAVSSGTFEDMYIGDYWTIGGVNYRIAAFNYYRRTGDTDLTTNHITLVPDTHLYTHVMNDTNITTGGYAGSKMYLTGLDQAKTTINAAFPSKVLTHRQILCNATVDGKASGWAWFDSSVDLMNEVMVYGCSVFGDTNLGGSGGGFNIGVGKTQLPLFALNHKMINTRQNFWLRDVVFAANFATVSGDGRANSSGASNALGVRPAFSIS